MTEKYRQKQLEQLNHRCEECILRHGQPTFDHCNYYCTIGNMIHRLDHEGERDRGSRQY